MKEIESALARLTNYERVLVDVIKTSKRELLCMQILNSFLRLCLNRDFTKISWDEFLRTNVHIDSRRFLQIVNGHLLLTDQEIQDLNAFVRMEWST